MMSELRTFQEYDLAATSDAYVYLGAAGFEDRAVQVAQLLASAGVRLVAAFILEFRENVIPANQENEARLMTLFREDMRVPRIESIQVETVESTWDSIKSICAGSRHRTIMDISAMPHGTILRSLRSACLAETLPLVVYTEAEEYYPLYQDAMKYLKYEDDELAFDAASRQEEEHVMYGGTASVGTVRGYEGSIMPTAPTALILFPTFKRRRTSGLLAEIEVNKKVFLIGDPVRQDLKWRKRALLVINYDLIDKDTDHVEQLQTLSPHACYSALTSLLQRGIVSPRENIVICPHGSKMQTVGVWKFCEDFPDTRVVLSHPKEYFPQKYSVGCRDSFVFDPMLEWPSPYR
jgi:hypothetical protein